MQSKPKGLLLVVSGPAGVGKGTIDKILLERHSNMKLSVSATTRNPRPGEVDGVHYFFIDEDKFRSMIDNGEFLEYMHVFNLHYYGTPRSFVEKELEQGNDVLLEIDVNGAKRVKESYPDAVLVFIAPPDLKQLKARLVGRGTETPEQIEKRFGTAVEEIRQIEHYDYTVVNDVLEDAVKQVESIISAEKSRVSRNTALVEELTAGGTEK